MSNMFEGSENRDRRWYKMIHDDKVKVDQDMVLLGKISIKSSPYFKLTSIFILGYAQFTSIQNHNKTF